jgi:tetratricopeptide (TPR) repeat protein
MPEIAVTSLPIRLQRQVDQARTAFDRGNTEYAINICREILKDHPGCLPVRRLLRATQLKVYKTKNPLVAKVVGAVRVVPALLAAQAMLKKHPANALVAIERALGADPSHVGALRVVAEAALALDLPETALFALESVREQKPDDRQVLIRLAEAYVAAGRSSEGLAIAESLLRDSPGDAVLQELLKHASVAQSINAGRWESGSGTFRDKLRDEQEAVALEQASKVVRSAEMTEHQLDDAIARQQAEPANLNHYREIVQCCRTLGRLDEAITWLGRARELPTGAADVTLEKLESELRIQRAAERVQQRESELAAAGGEPVVPDAELTRRREELSATRLGELRKFVDKYPNDLAYKFELGQALFAAGEIDQAIQQFQVVQRSPKLRRDALMQLGACFQAKRLYDLAVQQYETAKAENLSFDEYKKEAIYQLGCCFEAMGRGERAVEEFKLIYSWDIGFRDVAARIDRFYSSSRGEGGV